jgi:hypothetical protein
MTPQPIDHLARRLRLNKCQHLWGASMGPDYSTVSRAGPDSHLQAEARLSRRRLDLRPHTVVGAQSREVLPDRRLACGGPPRSVVSVMSRKVAPVHTPHRW